MFAVIKTGGKQFRVEEGAVIRVPSLKEEQDAEIDFNEVLLTVNEDDIKVGKPFVNKASVSGKILSHGKDKKIIVYKYLRRKDSSKKVGHRQKFTEIKINKINLS